MRRVNYSENYFFKSSTFNSQTTFCITSKGTFGSPCDTSVSTISSITTTSSPRSNSTNSTSQCNAGLVCSKLGSNTGYCLYDKGGKCSNNNDCANLLFCQVDGTCGCTVINSSISASACKELNF